MAEQRGRIRAGAPRGLGRRRRLRDLSQQDRERGNVIVIAATAPLVVAFLARGSELTLGLAASSPSPQCFIIRLLDEHFRLFAEIVRSRFVIAEKQRIAEEARAGGHGDRVDRQPHRAAQPALLSKPARRQNKRRDRDRRAVRPRPDRSRRFKPINEFTDIRPGTKFSNKSPSGSPRQWMGAAQPRGWAATNSPSCAMGWAQATRRSLSAKRSARSSRPDSTCSAFGVRLSCASGLCALSHVRN